jgi:WD40 repeat protein
MPGTEAEEWWESLGTDHRALVRLPLDVFDSYLRRFVYEFEHWSEFNSAGDRPQQKKAMMIPKMASRDLYREFVPQGIEYLHVQNGQLEPTSSGFVTDIKTSWLESGSHFEASLLLLLGDYGTGKSAYAIQLAYEVAQNRLARSKPGLIPLYVDLRDYRRSKDIETFLTSVLSDFQVHIDAGRLRQLLREGRLLLIFDGFDEMASRGNVNDTLANFNEVKRLSLPGVKTVLTCRTHYFRSDRETRQVIDQQSLPLDNPLLEALKQHSGYVVVKLKQFSDDQIRQLIRRRAGGAQVDQLWNEISKRYNLLDLARRPVLLDMILATMPKLIASGDKISLADVYEFYTATWIERDDWRSHVTPEGKRKLAERLAWRMMEVWLGQGEQAERQSRMADAQDDDFSVSVAQLLETVGAISGQWLKYPASAEESTDRIDYDFRTCSFLRRDSNGRYSFSHRSFLEYFSARYLLNTVDSQNSPLLNRRLGSYATAINWNWPSPEVVAFIISILKGILRAAPKEYLRLLSLTSRPTGSGGNGLTIAWEALRRLSPEDPVGRNLRDCVAFALDLSERDLTGADLSNAALASPCLERTGLRDTRWERASCRINHVYDVTFGSTPSTVCVGSGNGMLSKWDLTSGTRLACLHVKSDYVFDMSIHESANLWAYTTWDGWIQLHRRYEMSPFWSRYGEGAGSGKVALSSSGRYLAAGSWDGHVGIWDCSSDGIKVGGWHAGKRVNCIAFDPADKYVLAGVEDGIFLQEIGTGKRFRIPGEHNYVEAAAFSPDGTLLAIAAIPASAPFRLIKVFTGEIVFEMPTVYGYTMAFSRDGSQLAVGNTIIDVSSRTWRQIGTVHGQEIKSVQFSLDGTQLLSGGFDGTVQVSDALSGTLLNVLDLGINCYGADITGAFGFGELSSQWKSDWEMWWSGAALRERLLRCGAAETASLESRISPRAVWEGGEYSSWQSSLKWDRSRR